MEKTNTHAQVVRPIRRLVTGIDARGRSVFLSDEPAPHVMTLHGIANFGVTDLWKTRSAPVDLSIADDTVTLPIELAPPERGTVLRVVEFAPDADWMGTADAGEAFASMGKSGAEALGRTGAAPVHPMMHTTRSLDYAIVLTGEIWAVLDDGERKMQAGDILIQRGTNHAWSNRTTELCRMAFVLIDGAW